MFPEISKTLEFDLMDAIYRGECADPMLDIAQPAFGLLDRVLPFSTGVTLRIDPRSWALAPGFAVNCDGDLMRRYLDEFVQEDPYVRQGLSLRNPGRVVRWSEHVDVRRLARSHFGEFMRAVGDGYYHCLAAVPLVRGYPAAVFSVHRTARQSDFSVGEERVFQWFVDHLARGLDYQNLLHAARSSEPRAMIAFERDGQLLAISEEAEQIVKAIPGSDPLPVPAPGAGERIWTCGRQNYKVSTCLPGPGSLLQSPSTSSTLTRRVSRALRSRLASPAVGQRVVAVLVPAGSPDDLESRVGAMGLPRRRRQVLQLLLEGKKRSAIAREMKCSEDAVKDQLRKLYREFEVGSRAELAARIFRQGEEEAGSG